MPLTNVAYAAHAQVIGSDGLTERWPVKEIARCVAEVTGSGSSSPHSGADGGSAGRRLAPTEIARALVLRALQRGSTDNVSAVSGVQ